MLPYLELKDISKSFSGVRALRGVNLRLEQGEIRCLVGENVSGKSTLIKLVAGVALRARRKKILKKTKGQFGKRKNVWTVAKNSYEKGQTYAYHLGPQMGREAGQGGVPHYLPDAATQIGRASCRERV